MLTDFPVLVGGSAAYELPGRLRSELTVGMMPGLYVDTINWAMTTFDVYSETTAELIDVILQGSIIVHAQVGYRPWEHRGFTGALGYQNIGLIGDTTDISLYADAQVSQEMLDRAQAAVGDLEVVVSPHMITGEVGYQWHLREQLVLRTSLAFAYTLNANATVSATQEAPTPLGREALEAVTVASEDYLISLFEEWVHLPMLGVSVGYRFF